MNKLASLLAISLLLASSLSWSEVDRSSSDVRYCLDLESNDEIAKCAGEIAPGNKGKPLSREEAEKILSRKRPGAPVSANESSGIPLTTIDRPGKDFPEKTESPSN